MLVFCELTLNQPCELLDYVISEDCGTIVNPMIVDGQIIGGALQGVGTALYEESCYDADGQPLSSAFADYMMPDHTFTKSSRRSFGDAIAAHRMWGERARRRRCPPPTAARKCYQ